MPWTTKTEPPETSKPERKPLVWLSGAAVVMLEVYGKKTRKIPDEVIDRCRDRLKKYDAITRSTKNK